MARWIYRLRYKLCRHLLPKRLAVWMYDGAEYVTVFDDDTKKTWGYARVENAKVIFRGVLTETEIRRPENPGHTPQ